MVPPHDWLSAAREFIDARDQTEVSARGAQSSSVPHVDTKYNAVSLPVFQPKFPQLDIGIGSKSSVNLPLRLVLGLHDNLCVGRV
jgi:hypothetical protein